MKRPTVVPDATLREQYQAITTTLSTVEMTILLLSKHPHLQRVISVEDAAVKLVRLLGYGTDYFEERRDWSISNWVRHLARLDEEDLPLSTHWNGERTTPVATYQTTVPAR